MLVSFGWYFGLFVAFLGWGALFARYVARDGSADIGLKVGWGVGVIIAFGGILLAAHVAKAPVLIGLVIAGQLGFLLDCIVRRRDHLPYLSSVLRLVRERPATAVMVALILLIVLGRMLSAPFVPSTEIAHDDDAVAYLYFPKQIVEAGRTVQPFSLRHVESLSGQAFLQSLAVAVLGIQRAYGLDGGLFVLVAVVVLSGVSKRRWLERSPWEVLPELALAVFPPNMEAGAPVPNNLTCHITGIAMLLTVYRTLRHSATVPPSWRSFLTVALATASAFVLRPFFVPMLAILVATCYGWPLLRWKSTSPFGSRLLAFLLVGVFTLALLIPWSICSYRSGRTPLYPLLPGNVSPMLPRLHRLSYDIWEFAAALNGDRWIHSIFIFALAGLCIRERQHRGLRGALLFGAFLCAILITRTLPGNWEPHLKRYLAPLFATVAFALAAEAMSLLPAPGEPAPRSVDRFVPAMLAALAIVIYLHEGRDAIGGLAVEGAEGIRLSQDRIEELRKQKDKYAIMQAAIPPGQGVLVATKEGYLFNFGRNPIYTLDYAAVAGPPPGWPLGSPPEDTARYLLGAGVHYVAVALDKPHPYNPSYWQQQLGSYNPLDPTLPPHIDWGPTIFAGLNLIDAVVNRFTPVFQDANFVIVDLATPR